MVKPLLRVSQIRVFTFLGRVLCQRQPRTCCIEIFGKFRCMIKLSFVGVVEFFACDLYPISEE
jgi:hypothetical protein